MHPNGPRDLQFTAWMEEHRGILVKIARSFARNPADAADLEQEMMLQLWVTMGQFSGESKASTWIYRVCLNTALNWHRGTGRRERRFESGADVAECPAGGASPAEAAAKLDLLEQLYGAIRSMPDFDRALILLMLDGLAYREISEVTGLTENHVGVVLTRARAKLAERLKGISHELE
jgi:RNA polymerase sigma-70 factor (ECF subfamily)